MQCEVVVAMRARDCRSDIPRHRAHRAGDRRSDVRHERRSDMNTSIESEETLRELLAEFADDRAECWRHWTGEWDMIGDIALHLAATTLADSTYKPYLGYMDVLWPDGTAFEGMGSLHPLEIGPLDLADALVLLDQHARTRRGESMKPLARLALAANAMHAWTVLFDVAIREGCMPYGANSARRLTKFVRCLC
jgi:hypothetical protein